MTKRSAQRHASTRKGWRLAVASYATGPGGVLVISPEGKHLGTIRIPEVAANAAWGDADGKTLYVTARTGLYRIKLNVAGVRP